MSKRVLVEVLLIAALVAVWMLGTLTLGPTADAEPARVCKASSASYSAEAGLVVSPVTVERC